MFDKHVCVILNFLINADGFEGLKTVEIIDKIYMSATQNNKI